MFLHVLICALWVVSQSKYSLGLPYKISTETRYRNNFHYTKYEEYYPLVVENQYMQWIHCTYWMYSITSWRETHYVSLIIHVKRRICNTNTTNVVISNTTDSKYWYTYWKKILLFLKEKDSMAGRTSWYRFKHRVEETKYSSNENEISLDKLNNGCLFNPYIYERIWRGIHIIYSFGNRHQLPIISMKYKSDLNSRPAIHKSGIYGIFSFKEFLNYTEDGTRSYVVVIYEVKK